MNAKLIAINVPSSNVSGTAKLYSNLLGITAARSLTDGAESYHLPLREGVFLWINPPANPNDTAATPYFAVDNLTTAVSAATSAGGEAIGTSFNLPVAPSMVGKYSDYLESVKGQSGQATTVGKVQLVKEVGGQIIGLVELDKLSSVFYSLDGELSPTAREDHAASVALGKEWGMTA